MSIQPDDARFEPDRLWIRGRRGTTLLAGSPMTLFRVTGGGARVLDALEDGHTLPVGHEKLTVRLLATGAIHPVPPATAPAESITVVVPAYLTDPGDVEHLRASITALSPLGVIVVDDASPIDITAALAGSPARVVRLATNGGPAAARNAGLALVDTSVVAFLDTDVVATPEDIGILAGMVLHGAAALVAPRIGTPRIGTPRIGTPRIGTSWSTASTIAEFERHRSPLDMGSHPAVVRPGGRVPYVPSALLVCDARTIREHGAFDPAMRTGEDVDLVWRLTKAGMMCRYVPAVTVAHRPRPTVGRFVRQRVGYGRSAGDLAERHGRAVAPFRSHFLTALPAASMLLAFPFIAIVTGLVALAWVSFSLRIAGAGPRATTRLALASVLGVGSMLARAIRREWWPLAVLAGVVWERAAFALFASIVVPLTVHLVRTTPRRPFGTIALSIIDDVSYGIGVWGAVLSGRTVDPLRPAVGLRVAVTLQNAADRWWTTVPP